jgi:hypothetical protein
LGAGPFLRGSLQFFGLFAFHLDRDLAGLHGLGAGDGEVEDAVMEMRGHLGDFQARWEFEDALKLAVGEVPKTMAGGREALGRFAFALEEYLIALDGNLQIASGVQPVSTAGTKAKLRDSPLEPDCVERLEKSWSNDLRKSFISSQIERGNMCWNLLKIGDKNFVFVGFRLGEPFNSMMP